MTDKILTADELIHILDSHEHVELHVHHTWKPEHSDFNGSNHLALQEGMRRFHIDTNGWTDIGQHVTLMPDGKFVTGRNFDSTPASIKGFNTGGFACEMLGNFDEGHDKLEGAQLDSIIKLANYFYKKGKYIRFHREDSPKTCPGTGIDKEKFMEQVKSYGVEKEVKQTIPDVKKDYTGHWAESYIKRAIESGVMVGFPDGTFRPGLPVSRAELAVVVAKLLDKLK